MQIALLLRHLWATDGCIWTPPPGVRHAARVYYATTSPGLAGDVAALLLRLGITAVKETRQCVFENLGTYSGLVCRKIERLVAAGGMGAVTARCAGIFPEATGRKLSQTRKAPER